MRARDYAPAGPLNTEPAGPYCRPDIREAALLDDLRDVEVGAYDRRIVTWLSCWDDPTVRTVVSMLGRVRQAGHAAGFDEAGEHGG